MIEGGDAVIPRRKWSMACSPNAAVKAIIATVRERSTGSGFEL
jgi:hypothetical protein